MTNRPSQTPKYLPIQAYQYYNQTLLGILPFPPPADTIYPQNLHPQNAPPIMKNIHSLPPSIRRLLMPVSSRQIQQASLAAQPEFQKPVLSYNNNSDGARLRNSQDPGTVYMSQIPPAPGLTASVSQLVFAQSTSIPPAPRQPLQFYHPPQKPQPQPPQPQPFHHLPGDAYYLHPNPMKPTPNPHQPRPLIIPLPQPLPDLLPAPNIPDAACKHLPPYPHPPSLPPTPFLGELSIPPLPLRAVTTLPADSVQGAGNESDEKGRKQAEEKKDGWVLVSSGSTASLGKKDGVEEEEGEEDGGDGMRFQVIYPPER